MTIALPLSAALMTISVFLLKDLIALYSSFINFFFFSSVFLPKQVLFSRVEHRFKLEGSPSGLKDDLSLKDLCSKGTLIGV